MIFYKDSLSMKDVLLMVNSVLRNGDTFYTKASHDNRYILIYHDNTTNEDLIIMNGPESVISMFLCGVMLSSRIRFNNGK